MTQMRTLFHTMVSRSWSLSWTRIGLGLFCGLLLAAACTKESNQPLPENVPPVTYLSIQAQIPDTLDYRVPLHWWGSDRDGQVVGYYVHWSGAWVPPAGSHRWAVDSTWVFTTATADTFATPTGPAPGNETRVAATDTFQVRAVDNMGAVDPVGRRQIFHVHNWTPDLTWDPALSKPTTSICVVSLAVRPFDSDGRSTVHLEYWLDGTDSTRAWSTPDSIIVLSPTEFDGRYGQRTLSVRSVDDSGTPSHRILRHRWTVEEPPTEDYLLIDNIGRLAPRHAIEDAFYDSAMVAVTQGNFYYLDLNAKSAFRTSKDVYRYLSLFKGVVWYSGVTSTETDPRFVTTLALAQEGIGQYLDQGGRLLIVSSTAVGAGAGLTVAFAEDRLGLDSFFQHVGRQNGVQPDTILVNDILHTDAAGPADSLLKTTQVLFNVDYMNPRSRTTPLLWVPKGTLRSYAIGRDSILVVPSQKDTPAALGVLRETRNSRFAVITVPLSPLDGLGNRDVVAEAIFRRVLLDTP